MFFLSLKKFVLINYKLIYNFCFYVVIILLIIQVVKKFARLNKKNIDEDIFVKATVNTKQETNNNNEEVIHIYINILKSLKTILD